MNTLKIIKIEDGLFKHVIGPSNQEFFTTNNLKLNVFGGLISFNTPSTYDFVLPNVIVQDLNSSTELTFATLDLFLKKLQELGYPCLGRVVTVPVSVRPNTTGLNGTTPFKLISAATTNANVVKNSSGNLYSIIAIGLSSTVRFLKIYNKSTTPTVGTDVPLMTVPIPANSQGAGVAIPFSMGVNFAAGIAIAITSGAADNDAGAVLAGEVIINLTFA